MISYIDNTKNVVTEVPITIAASSWSSSAPYTYTWSDARILAGSSVEVDILSTTADTSVISLDYEKSVGSITFTASSQPTTSISVNICIINARADLGSSISADTVATDAISGASNVDQALEALNGNFADYVRSSFKSSAVDLNTLVTDSPACTKRWRGDSCANLTNAPVGLSSAVPWSLEAGVVGSNINYQYQEFRLYQSLTDGAGSKIFRRQKYYYGVNDFRWNDWVSIDNKVFVIVSATVTIGTINANTYTSGTVDVDIPAGTNGVKSVIPRYTSVGFPIAGAYPVSGASSGKSRVLVGVYNFTSSSVSNVTATVDVMFMY